MALPPKILSAFVTLFVTIGPIETAVVFASLTAGVQHQDRRSLATKAILIAGAMLTLFALDGTTALSLLLHVSLPAFRVAGGLLLFLQALTPRSPAPVCRPSARASDVMPNGPAILLCFLWRSQLSPARAACLRSCSWQPEPAAVSKPSGCS